MKIHFITLDGVRVEEDRSNPIKGGDGDIFYNKTWVASDVKKMTVSD